MDWYNKQTEWSENHSYDAPKVSSQKLRDWFTEMIKIFPAMNGPYASDNHDNDNVSDYSIGMDVIYVAFAWSVSEKESDAKRIEKYEYKEDEVISLEYTEESWPSKEIKTYQVDFEYKYDDKGNWNEIIKKVDGKELYKWTRQIEYYK